METIRVSLLLLLCCYLLSIEAATNPQDAAALRSLMDNWKNLPPNWRRASDPCDSRWDGVTCSASRITNLALSTMSIKGTLSGDIGQLTELVSLDLSFNQDLTGPVSAQIGELKNLNTLILAGCGFSGEIPDEIGNLQNLAFMALNSNNFTGNIPASLGSLSKLYWLDLADNQLSGNIPVSTDNTPGLDQLLEAKHFHFNKNQLKGSIPPKLFNSSMKLLHVLFDGNRLTGGIPSTLGDLKVLEALRLDRNFLSGPVPPKLGNISTLSELHLAKNQLSGPIPDLTGMKKLNYVDLSNNSFDPSEAPGWFSTINSLSTLVIEHGNLVGTVPQKLFSFPQMQQVLLKNNSFNNTLDMGNSISQQLKVVDLENNNIMDVKPGAGYSNILLLIGNPVCNTGPSNRNYCQEQQQKDPDSTSLASCKNKVCVSGMKLSPQSCDCSHPFEGTLYFRAPFFRDLSNAAVFQELESTMWTNLSLTPGSVSVQNPFFNVDDYLEVHLGVFPSADKYFHRTEVMRIAFFLSNQTYKPPREFGPYYFIANPYYPFEVAAGGNSLSVGVIVGIAIGTALLILILIVVAIYAIRQKKRAEKAIKLGKPFASWAPSGKDSGGAPQLKGARWFSYDELRKCTNNFLDSNVIGFGGYGKVYRGMLFNGEVVAIKRAQQGSMQGGSEFKTEIELLSRVHHKNLVGLVGFCFEQGEQMLVYEFMPNGTLRESLSGRSGITLDWKKRLRIALGSARGLAYLHDLANPPIIHRDVKSTNILLDETLTAKVADFGLSKLVADTQKGHVSTQVKGTLGYLDPEYYMTQQLTEKSDVYSFGVVMLELVTARQPIEKGKYIVREVLMVMDRNDERHYGVNELMDPTIRNVPILVGFGRFMDLALRCVKESAADRPTMNEVVKEIETMLQNEGLNTNSNSEASWATEFGSGKGGRHPYLDGLSKKEINNSDSFDYSGGYGISTKVEPK